jgi:hypothetical protein
MKCPCDGRQRHYLVDRSDSKGIFTCLVQAIRPLIKLLATYQCSLASLELVHKLPDNFGVINIHFEIRLQHGRGSCSVYLRTDRVEDFAANLLRLAKQGPDTEPPVFNCFRFQQCARDIWRFCMHANCFNPSISYHRA